MILFFKSSILIIGELFQHRKWANDIEHSCCFTGHRNINSESLVLLKTNLNKTIENMINQGITNFYAGGALGFDTIASECVLEHKKTNSKITLTLILPCKTQCRGWKKKDMELYEDIKNRSDKVIYTSDEYTSTCMFERNRMLVDACSVCICYKTKNNGGTAYTVSYAKRNNKKVINLA